MKKIVKITDKNGNSYNVKKVFNLHIYRDYDTGQDIYDIEFEDDEGTFHHYTQWFNEGTITFGQNVF